MIAYAFDPLPLMWALDSHARPLKTMVTQAAFWLPSSHLGIDKYEHVIVSLRGGRNSLYLELGDGSARQYHFRGRQRFTRVDVYRSPHGTVGIKPYAILRSFTDF